ncbi:MAG: ABC transporter ATP-binding protein [Gemmatimonadaceae bacterium]
MITLEKLASRAGSFTLHDVSITLPKGAWGIVLGPAGSGKTTLLETIAGIRAVTSGRVLLRGADVTTLPAEGRRVGMVYQHGYLFPHLSVEENIAYGARDPASAHEMAERFGAKGLSGRSVTSLSGGERQIVALARALAPAPDILLLDEPFAALDPRRRVRVRAELRRLQRERGMTVLHVTHDFVEAGTLGDLAMVLDDGRLSQVGTPDAIFRRPASGAVADFIGAENVYSGTIARGASEGDIATLTFSGDGLTLIGVGDHPGGAGHAVVRGEDVVLARRHPNPSSARNVLEGRILEVAPNGVLAQVTIALGASTLVAIVTQESAITLGLAPGESVVASIKATAVHLC